MFKKEFELDYKTIHKEYLSILNLSKDDNIKLEVLKRLIFLNWEFIVESEVFTGIVDLDETAIKNSYEVLNSYIKLGLIDNEMKWMLEYYSDWDWIVLLHSENKPELIQFVKSVDSLSSSLPKKQLTMGTMDNRGQMGLYWKAVVEKID